MATTAALNRWTSRPALLAVAAGLGALVAVAIALWARYGAAVFYEIAVAGIGLCF